MRVRRLEVSESVVDMVDVVGWWGCAKTRSKPGGGGESRERERGFSAVRDRQSRLARMNTWVSASGTLLAV